MTKITINQIEYWQDSYGNVWDCSKFTEEQAILARSNLTNCYDCENCVYCYDCQGCINCVLCKNCTECTSCNACFYCKKCDSCKLCTGKSICSNEIAVIDEEYKSLKDNQKKIYKIKGDIHGVDRRRRTHKIFTN